MSQHFHNTFYFQLWLVLVWYFIIYIYNIFIINYRWQIVTSFKLWSPLKIVHLKKTKTSPRRLLVEQWILAHPIWLNQKKVWEHNKMLQYFHNIYFNHGRSCYDILLFILRKCKFYNIFTKKSIDDKLLLILN